MICSKCREEGERSIVRSGGGFSTNMAYQPYWDEDGVYHMHDVNAVTISYKCSRGHEIIKTGHHPCPQGDFGGYEVEYK